MTNNISILQKHNVALRMCYENLNKEIEGFAEHDFGFTKKVLKDSQMYVRVAIRELEKAEQTIRDIDLEAKQK